VVRPFARHGRNPRGTAGPVEALLLAVITAVLVAPGTVEARAQAAASSSSPAATTDTVFALFDPGPGDAWRAQADTPAAVAVLERATVGLTRPPGAIPVIHTEGTLPGRGIREISGRAREDFPVALALALAYRLTGDARYARRAETYLTAWATTYRWSFNPIDETSFDTLIMATDLVDDALSPEAKARIDGFWRALSVGYLDAMDGTPINAETNWQSHRIKLATLAAYRVGDPALIARAREAYRRHVSGNILADGSVHDFHERDAIHYVTYNLDPLMTAALAAQGHGEDWFGWRNASGAGAREAVTWLLPYAEGRRTHQEFVNSRIKFDADRARVGQAGYEGQWDRAGAVNTLRLARLMDPRFCAPSIALERATERPASVWLDWFGRSSARRPVCPDSPPGG
jgi:hypothetical protein